MRLPLLPLSAKRFERLVYRNDSKSSNYHLSRCKLTEKTIQTRN